MQKIIIIAYFLAVGAAKFTAKKFGEDTGNGDASHVGPTVSAVRGDDVVGGLDRRLHADAAGLLAVVQVAEATDN